MYLIKTYKSNSYLTKTEKYTDSEDKDFSLAV